MVKNRLGSILFDKEESAGLDFLWIKFVHPKSILCLDGEASSFHIQKVAKR